ncbi:hypothetical protein SAMN02910298_01195 [Pseudobutyrivibrio sp. YE44]|uniref:hypothetical protein n=1 Tax=Pseudobutyrivibrio sp. YE44 TaxID=1520802 RepID=UPI00088FEC55|nr:hypothetical protein [Pseudobutyrivibrio sp. YE44]SDB24131.1 hypothetical protein SAMN02910298_01195 [Pseudobutyrivibrio sp. YE44]
MKDISLFMGLMDFIPVILFAITTIMLMRDFYYKMSKGAFALFSMGTLDIVCAGGLKALYKVLYGAGICDFQALSQMFFPLQSIGFLVTGVACIAMIYHKQGNTLYSAVPPIFAGTFVFVFSMCFGLGMICYSLCVLAKRLNKKFTIVAFLLNFILCLGMGYLSSKDFAQASINWAAQCINIVSQGCLLLGVVSLHKAGLADLVIER